MARFKTVDDIIDEIRSQIDEENQETIDDDIDILPAMNRALNYAANILARHYEEPLLVKDTLALNGTDEEYDIPEDAFEDRIEQIEIEQNNTFYEVQRASYRDISFYETQTKVNIPYYYVIIGRKLRFVPRPTGTFNARIWYLKKPEQLVKSQGRITVVNSGSNYVTVDSIGADVTTESDNLQSFVNIVDGQTGVVKGTLQVKTITDNQITFKSTPTRTTVENRTVSSGVSTLTGDNTIELDDFVSIYTGSCVPFLRNPLGNFLVQYSVAELTRKLGGSADMEERVLQKFEQQMERTWVGRETTLRVQKRNRNWDLPFRRWYHAKF